MRLRISTLGKYGHVQVLHCKKAAFCGRIRAPPNTWFTGPLRIHTPNGISTGLVVTSRQTDTQTDHANDAIYVAMDRILCYALLGGLKSKNRCFYFFYAAEIGLKLLLDEPFIDVLHKFKYIIFS